MNLGFSLSLSEGHKTEPIARYFLCWYRRRSGEFSFPFFFFTIKKSVFAPVHAITIFRSRITTATLRIQDNFFFFSFPLRRPQHTDFSRAVHKNFPRFHDFPHSSARASTISTSTAKWWSWCYAFLAFQVVSFGASVTYSTQSLSIFPIFRWLCIERWTLVVLRGERQESFPLSFENSSGLYWFSCNMYQLFPTATETTSSTWKICFHANISLTQMRA